jgi:hypothetical protein
VSKVATPFSGRTWNVPAACASPRLTDPGSDFTFVLLSFFLCFLPSTKKLSVLESFPNRELARNARATGKKKKKKQTGVSPSIGSIVKPRV